MTKTTLSIDIGVRNLAMCVMTRPDQGTRPVIDFWENIDTLEPEPLCTGVQKNGNTCGKKCSAKGADGTPSCKNHAVSPSKPFKIRLVKSIPKQELILAVLASLEKFINENEPVIEKINKVLIELQPNVNPTMKLVSHVVYTRFIQLFLKRATVTFIRASTKLKCKVPGLTKGTCRLNYAQRKRTAVDYTKCILERYFPERYTPFCETKVQADLADAFLYCVNDHSVSFF